MECRILHCGKSVKNLSLSVEEKVVGFTKNVANQGDMVYLAVRLEEEKKTICVARGVLGDRTDNKPWHDSSRYVQCFKMNNLEICEGIDLALLREFGGDSWVMRYIQGSKEIKDKQVVSALDNAFKSSPPLTTLSETILSNYIIKGLAEPKDSEQEEYDYLGNIEDECVESIEPKGLVELDIMGTFQTIRFKNETDSVSGLEPLVNKHFFNLFKHFTENNTVMISDNRLFRTAGVKDEDDEKEVTGVKGIPDAVLISYDKDNSSCPLKVNIIEYECYGEKKVRSSTKFNYLNGTVIPQLIRFASAFSIATDSKLRETTINEWTEKIMDNIDADDELSNRAYAWIKEIHPSIKERNLALSFKEELIKAFRQNIRILLIIDELTNEQKETIKNIIQSFKLGNGESIEFNGYVVRLEQRINIFDKDAQYALSFQE